MFILIKAQHNDDNVIFIVRIGLRDGYDKNVVIESDHRQKNTPSPQHPGAVKWKSNCVPPMPTDWGGCFIQVWSGLAGPDYNEGLDPASS